MYLSDILFQNYSSDCEAARVNGRVESSRVESMRFNDRDRANKSSRKRIIAYTVKLCRRSTQDFTGKTGGERRKGKKLNPRDIR